MEEAAQAVLKPRTGKSSCIQALPSSWPLLPSCKSGGASLASAKSRRGTPGAARED